MSADIISRFIELLNAAQPTFSEELATNIERQLRHEYRGERVYIAKHPDNLHDIVRSRFTGNNVDKLAAELKISRRTVYRTVQKGHKFP